MEGRRGPSIDVLLGVGEGLGESGRCVAEADDRPRWEGLTTRDVRVDGDRARIGIGLEPRGVGVVGELASELMTAVLEEVRMEWPRGMGVGVSGGLGRSSLGRVGVVKVSDNALFVKRREGEDGDDGIAGGLDLVARCREEILEFESACPFIRLSRLGIKGAGALTSLFCGCKLALLDLSREGDTRAALKLEEEAGTADCDFGEGNAWDERCRAGDDIDPWRKEGVMKLDKPALRTLSCLSGLGASLSAGGAGG